MTGAASHRPLLAVDLGNTRCKLWLFEAGGERPLAELALAADELDGERLDAFLRGVPPDALAAVSAVGDAARATQLLERLDARLDGRVAARPDPGLHLAVQSPETTGRDRLFAARGALVLAEESAIVVDAGTALTVDAVRYPGPVGSAGTFEGGAIAPGPELLARVLGTGARLPSSAPRPGVPALGKDTRGALEAGVAVGFAGAALHLVERVSAESGITGRIWVTGGAHAFVEPVLFGTGRPVEVVPHLVALGLRAAVL